MQVYKALLAGAGLASTVPKRFSAILAICSAICSVVAVAVVGGNHDAGQT
jgi:hypothetical protein